MIERLRQEMARLGINARELSTRANIGHSFVYDLLSGRSSNPTTNKMTAIAEALGVSLPYLISGTSNDNDFYKHGADFIAIPFLLNPAHTSNKLVCDNYLLNRKWISASLKVTPENLRMVDINGDCMSPTFNHQDIVLIDTSNKVPADSGIFILQSGAGIMARRMEFVPEKIPAQVCISPDNNKYSAHTYRLDEIEVLGKVVWVGKNI